MIPFLKSSRIRHAQNTTTTTARPKAAGGHVVQSRRASRYFSHVGFAEGSHMYSGQLVVPVLVGKRQIVSI